MKSVAEISEHLLAKDRRTERRLVWGELAVIALVLALVFWRLQFGE